MRARTAVVALAAVAATVLAAAPAHAQAVTFTLSAGVLSIAEPAAPAALTAAGPLVGLADTSATGSLGSTVVTDDRAGVLGWTSKISASGPFTNGTTSIPVSNVTVWVPGAIATTGTVTATAGAYVSAATALTLSTTGQPFVTANAVVGNNTATFDPSLSILIPAGATAGTYTGTVTQTVS